MVAPYETEDDERELSELKDAESVRIRPKCLEETKAFFSPESPLKTAESFGGRPYEPRPQQAEMALEVAHAFETGENLCIEAPTGVGKSFAYLVPAIYASLSMKKPVLVTTETLNLQEQLVYKDLPLLKKLLGLDIKFVLAKGRGNYLCKRRLGLATGGHRNEFMTMPGFVSETEEIARWAEKTEDGSKYDIDFRIDPELWSSLCSDASSCSGPSCSHFKSCFYWKARREWDNADIVVTNHALFFVDLKIRDIEHLENNPLPDYGAVVFDEAHTMEDSAADHLGLNVRSGAVRGFLNRLYNPTNAKGLLMKPGGDSMNLRAVIAKAFRTADDFFAQYFDAISQTQDDMLRLRRPKFRNCLSDALGEISKLLKEYIDNVEEADFKQELVAQRDRCEDYRESIASFNEMLLENHVYWAEGRLSPITNSPMTELSASPLDIPGILRKILFSTGTPVILTSATLAVNGSLDYYFKRTGFCGGVGLVLDSPFDYSKQVRLYIPGNSMPLPSEEGYTPSVCEKILEFIEKTSGRAFVLFTSYGMLKTCAEKLSDRIRSMGIRLLVHGESLSRTAMLTEFKDTSQSSVIFGATSFWTGVDVPGNALSNVIITKLPFAVPSHPLIEARLEQIKESGGRPFEEYSVPDAVLKFRQGIGRLIRSRTDTGIIVVLDRRIVTKYYGRRFLNSIPECPTEQF